MKRNSALAAPSGENSGYSLKELGAMLKLLICNPTFVCLTLADTVDTFLLNGFVSFAPKFLEQQFGLTASQAAIYGGILHKPFVSEHVGTVAFHGCENVMKANKSTPVVFNNSTRKL